MQKYADGPYSGIPTMRREMKQYGLPKPEFYEERDSFKVIFRNTNVVNSGQQAGQQINIEYNKKRVLEFCNEPKTAKEINSRQYISTNIIKPLINERKLDYTNKNGINAKNQKYITIK